MEKVIEREYQKEIEVDKSTFIAYFFPCDNIEKFKEKFNEIKKEHNKAKHHCYAYKINNVVKSSDDGEPSGTAGKPILNIIEYNSLNNVAIVIVRYFGGVLLGSGRLLRTYSLSATEVINIAKLKELIEEKLIKIEIDIDSYDTFKNYLSKKHFNIKNINFNDKIEIEFYSSLETNDDWESLFYPKLKLISVDKIKHVKED